jgi:hypothetical protein
MEQRFRLQMEGVRFIGQRVDMAVHECKFAKTPRRKKSQK